MTAKRPLSIDIVTPKDGGDPHVRIRAAGNRTTILSSQTYKDDRSPANAVYALVEAIRSGNFQVRYVTESTP